MARATSITGVFKGGVQLHRCQLCGVCGVRCHDRRSRALGAYEAAFNSSITYAFRKGSWNSLISGLCACAVRYSCYSRGAYLQTRDSHSLRVRSREAG